MHVDYRIHLRHAYPGAEIPYGRRRIAAAPPTRQCWHARVVPSVHTFFLDELQESIHREQEAIARTAQVSQRLRDARMELARLEAPALTPTG